jgi:hypothetical protein
MTKENRNKNETKRLNEEQSHSCKLSRTSKPHALLHGEGNWTPLDKVQHSLSSRGLGAVSGTCAKHDKSSVSLFSDFLKQVLKLRALFPPMPSSQ